jgi:hypothetical protein
VKGFFCHNAFTLNAFDDEREDLVGWFSIRPASQGCRIRLAWIRTSRSRGATSRQWVSAAAAFVMAAIVAAYLPARRAAAVDRVIALRAE